VSSNWNYVTYGNGTFVALSGTAGSSICATSTDGIIWTQRVMSSAVSWRAIVYGNGIFMATGTTGGGTSAVATSPDGINWTTPAIPSGGLSPIIYGNGQFIVFDNSSSVLTSSIDPNNMYLGSANPGYYLKVK